MANEYQKPAEGQVSCYPECSMHSLSRENHCAYNIAMMMGNKGEQVEYGLPCIHPDVFQTLVIEPNDKGALVARLE